MSQSHKFFCPVPWISYAIRSDGCVRVCCHANQSPSKGLLLKKDNSWYTYKDDIIETRNSKTLKQMRLSFLKQEWPEQCLRCKTEYEVNMSTRCIYENERWKQFISRDIAKKLTKSDGSIDNDEIPLRLFDLRFGNLCNMKCRMCSPTDSNQWYEEWSRGLGYSRFMSGDIKRYISQNEKGKYYLLNDPFQWHKEDIFWRNLESQIKNIRLCYLVGGEPLLIKRHYYFLKKCIELDCAKDISIDYNTNLSILPKHAFSLWNEFKNVNFGVSCDGMDNYNDYIRYPSKWEQTVKNLHIIDGLGPNVNLWFAYTVMVYNILHLPDMLEWRLSQPFSKMKMNKNKKIISSHPLHTPDYLCVKIFPQESKKYITEVLNERIKKFELSIYPHFIKENYKNVIESYIRFMNQCDNSHLIKKFWWFNDSLDKIRKQKFEDFIPEIPSLLGGENEELRFYRNTSGPHRSPWSDHHVAE